MNGHELVKSILTKKPTDRMGFVDKIWSETKAKWEAQGALQRKNEETGEMTRVSFCDWFDADMQELWGPFDTTPLMGYREIIEESNDWRITKDGFGAVFKRWKKKTGVPEHIRFDMNSMEVWQQIYKPHLLDLDEKRFNPSRIQDFITSVHQKNKAASCASVFTYEFLRGALGDYQLFISLIEDPDWILDFNRTYTDFFKMHYTYMFEHIAKPDHVWLYDDLAYSKGPFCSPDIIREYFVPFYKEMTDFFHSYDLPVVLHSCGYVESLLPLIVESGFDALNPMEVKAGCDVVRFAEKYGDKLSFFGGFDVRILENGDKDAIKKEVLRICDTVRRLGVGYMFGSDHSVPPTVDYESYRYAVEVFRENCYI